MVKLNYANLSILPYIVLLILVSCSAETTSPNVTFSVSFQSSKSIGELEWDILRLATGDYNEKELNYLHKTWMEDLGYIYNKVSKAIDKEMILNNEKVLEKLKESKEVVKKIYDQICKFKANYTVGILTLDFYKGLVNLVDLILDQNIRKLEGSPYLDWSKDNFVILFDEINYKYKYWFDSNPNGKILYATGIELYNLAKKVLNDIDEIETSNQIANYIYDGIKLVTRRWMALFAYLKRGGENRLKVKWAKIGF